MLRFHLVGLTLVSVAVAGCSRQHLTVADTFPKSSAATPWVLRDAVWNGTFEQAAEAFGDEAAEWGAFVPEHVWLAVYQHQSHRDHRVTVRALSFASADDARRAFDYFRPTHATTFDAGDTACWTDDGVLMLWGRLVFDIFAVGPAGPGGPEQAVYVLAIIEKQMPDDLPAAPR